VKISKSRDPKRDCYEGPDSDSGTPIRGLEREFDSGIRSSGSGFY